MITKENIILSYRNGQSQGSLEYQKNPAIMIMMAGYHMICCPTLFALSDIRYYSITSCSPVIAS